MVEIKLYSAVNGSKEFEAELKGFDEKTVTVASEEETITIERSNISSIRLAFVE